MNKQQKVFIVTREAFPNGMAATHRITCYAKALQQAGVKVEVVLYLRSEVWGRPPRNTLGSGVWQGIPFRYMGGTPLRHSRLVVRRYNDWADRQRTLRYLKENMQEGDALFLYLREDRFTKRLLDFAEKQGFAVARDLCEFPYANFLHCRNRERKQSRYLNNMLHRFNGTICISTALHEVASRHAPEGKHLIVPAMVDDTVSVPAYQHPRPYIFHGGTLSEKKDGILSTLKAFADAVHRLPHPIDFIIGGPSSPHQKELQDIIRERQIEERVIFLRELTYEQTVSCQRGASLAILFKHDNQQNRYGFSTKLAELLLAETAIITTPVGEAARWLTHLENAYIAKDAGMVADLIVRVFTNEEERQRIARKGKETALRHFTPAVHSQALATFFHQLTQKP